MSLSEGTKLGAYEITGKIGAGGMGEVYRATDTKLGREVAIKTLPAALASDKDRLARFEREATLLAALHHPHIASVFSLDEHEGTLYLAMELVEGETLEDRLKRGAMPVEDALRLALQVAEALEAAHSKGVIHRDLKPANIMVTAEGQAKVLDFGLAKAFSNEPEDAIAGQSPALSVAMTQQGIILGTAGYMSPEQASGQATDQRADVWAFGVVLYEMLTGLPLYSGESVPHILAAVLQVEPDWNRLPKNLHPRLKTLLERCLRKKPRVRYQAIGDVRVDIEEILSDPAGTAPDLMAQTEAAPISAFKRFALPVGAAVVAAFVAATAVWLAMMPEPRSVNQFEYWVPEDQDLVTFFRTMEMSRDGRRFAYRTEEGVYLREMGLLDARLISGTEPELADFDIMFSPDGESVAWAAIGTTLSAAVLQRIPISGGAPVLVADVEDATGYGGASWADDNTFLLALQPGILRVSANGGDLEVIIPAAEGERLGHPRLLPDGDSVLFSVATSGDFDQGQIVVQSLASGERKTLISGGSDARYVQTGHIVYADDDGLFGAAFDLANLEVTGGRVPLLQGVERSGVTGSANYAIAEDGTLIYLVGGGVTSQQNVLVWVDREGREEPVTSLAPGTFSRPRISPDGLEVALNVQDEAQSVWVFNLERGTLSPVTTRQGLDNVPMWSPDGERLVFATDREEGGRLSFFSQRADGTGDAAKLLQSESPGIFMPYGWSPDGSLMVFDYGPPGNVDIGVLNMDIEGDWSPLLTSDASEAAPALSPDGNWIAYASDRTGRCEIFVEQFPDLGNRRQISTNGGTQVVWSPDGSELFYAEPAGRLMSVAIDYEGGLNPGAPDLVYDGLDAIPICWTRDYDIAPNGERFLIIKGASGATSEQSRFIIVQNWLEELERLVPTN